MPGIENQIVLRAAGVGLFVNVAGGLPVIVHWGADLGPQTGADFANLQLSGDLPPGRTMVNRPAPPSILPEQWAGWLGRPGISGSRDGRSWTPQFAATAVRLDGRTIATGTLINAGAGRLEVDAQDGQTGLELTVSIELLPSGLIRARAKLTNVVESQYALNDMVIGFPVPPVAREILDFAGRWSKERVPQRQAWNIGTHLREGRKGRTGPDAATVLHVGTPGFSFEFGEVWGVHTAWSGNHTHYAERLWTGEQVIGGGELLLPGEIILDSGATYTSPWVYGAYGSGLDEVARRFHRFVRGMERHPEKPRPVTLNVWEAVYFDHDLAKLLDLAQLAAGLGVERFVLDDGWFGGRRNDRAGLGDWTVSPDAWPGGLHPLVDRVNELGMEFGLWFEPEMISADSDIARRHPEWIMQPEGRLPVEERHQQVINLGIPDCYDYVRGALFSLLEEYNLSYIKWDHNRDLVDAATSPAGRPGVHGQTVAFYRLLDEIHRGFPNLEIESCASGGARIDLEVLTRVDRIWPSDCIDPLERQEIDRWTSQLVPPEMRGAHIASGRSHTTGRVHDLNFRAASAIFEHLGIEWDLTQASSDELTELTAWIAYFRENRDFLHNGDMVRIDVPDNSVLAHGVVSPDRKRALFSCASVARSGVVSTGRLRLPGLDPARRYRVRPVLVSGSPHGLSPAPWWRSSLHTLAPSLIPDGVILSGAALGRVGLVNAELDVEQVLLISVEEL